MPKFSGGDGELATGHGLTGRRVLLPFEAELCDAVGITKDEYFEFLAQAESVQIKREGFEHVPDVRNELVTAAGTLTLAGQIVVSVAVGLTFTAIGMLLTPKPKTGDDDPRVDIRRPDNIGNNRFTPTFGFDSVQELAKLGQTVPLVFADQIDREDDAYSADGNVLRGGTRGNSLLTFSLLSSLGTSQRLQVFAVAGFVDPEAGSLIAKRPDYEGIAFGSQLLQDYNPARVAAYFRGDVSTGDGPIKAGDQYIFGPKHFAHGVQFDPPNGNPSKSWWHPEGGNIKVFAGTRNLSNESNFGLYNPMPNGNYLRTDFEMLILPDAAENKASKQVRARRDIMSAKLPVLASITDIKKKNGVVTEATYTISGDNNLWDDGAFFDKRPEVTGEEIKNLIQQERLRIDSALSEGEVYMLGNQIGTIVQKRDELTFGDLNSDKKAQATSYVFRMMNDGTGRPPKTRNLDATEKHWDRDATGVYSFSDAIIANNIACDCTEIGIGSTVWKKFNGTNVNNFPGTDFIQELEEDDRGANYDLGRIDAYLTRYSFFHIQVRKQGEDTWSENINQDGVFAVKGNTPVEQFNAVRIYHPRGQYEFRLRPYPGMLAYYRHVNNGKKIYLLDARRGLDDNPKDKFIYSISPIKDLPNFSVWFEGREEFLDEDNVVNPETFKGTSGPGEGEYQVTGFAPQSYGVIGSGTWENEPKNNNPRYVGPTPSNPYFDNDCARFMVLRRVQWKEKRQRFDYFWDGEKVGEVKWLAGTGIPNDEQLIETEQADPVPERCGNYDAKDDGTIRYQPRGVQTNDWEHIREDDPNQTVYYYRIVRKVFKDRTPDGPAVVVEPSGGSGSGLKFNLQKYTDGSYDWTLKNKGDGYSPNDKVTIDELPEAGQITLTVSQRVNVQVDPTWWKDGETMPYGKVADYYTQKKETASHHSQPESRVTYVNELVKADHTEQGTYEDLASVGFVLNSSKQITSFRQLSLYYRAGLEIENLSANGSGKDGVIRRSHLFPEIAYFLLTNTQTGAGNIISPRQIDKESFKVAADFCRANEFYWDGVIDERINIREFLFEQASYCLLDFTMKGGRFGLVPAVPTNSSGEILTNDDAIPKISALFTDGNIADMRVTTLMPEDRKLMEAEVLFREERINQFPMTRSMNVKLQQYKADLPVETYDLTQFCTSRRQAINFAKFALKARQWVDHTIEFKTTIQSISGLAPGDYIRVMSQVCHPDRFLNGHVDDQGAIQASQPVPDGTQVYYWRPGVDGVLTGTMRVTEDPENRLGGMANAPFRGSVFAAINQTKSDRVYKIDSIAIGEEGFVEVAATHMAVGGKGQLKLMSGWDADRDFVINGRRNT